MGFKDALAKQRPHGTATYTFDTLLLNGERSPKLEAQHAGSSNPAYVSNEVKMSAEAPIRRGKESERSRLERAQYVARKIAYGNVVVSWDHVHENPGEPVAPCTPEKVEEALLAIIETHYEEFTMFSAYVHDGRNFRDGDAGTGLELGKK